MTFSRGRTELWISPVFLVDGGSRPKVGTSLGVEWGVLPFPW